MGDCSSDLTSVDLSLLDPTTAPTSLLSTSNGTGSSISLFPFILIPQSFGLNLSSESRLGDLCRALDTKDLVEVSAGASEEGQGEEARGGSVESQEGDDELIIHIRFSELVRIKSILIGTGGGRDSMAPRTVKVWVNKPDGVSFEMINDKSDQEFDLLEGGNGAGGRGSTDYPVRISRFSNVSSLSLFFHNTSGREQSRLFYLGFIGEAKSLKKDGKTPLDVKAENAVGGVVDRIRETTGSSLASVR